MYLGLKIMGEVELSTQYSTYTYWRSTKILREENLTKSDLVITEIPSHPYMCVIEQILENDAFSNISILMVFLRILIMDNFFWQRVLER